MKRALLGLVIVLIYLPIAIYYHSCTQEVEVTRLQDWGPCAVYSYKADNKIYFGFSTDGSVEKGWLNPSKPDQIIFHKDVAKQTDCMVAVYAVCVAIFAISKGNKEIKQHEEDV